MSRRFIDLEENQCKNKKKFMTRKAAKKSMRRRYTSYRDMLAYRCPWCDMWHVGHKQGKPKKYKTSGEKTCRHQAKPKMPRVNKRKLKEELDGQL